MLRQASIAGALAVVTALAGCGGSAATKEDFRQSVLGARNDADAGLEQVVQAESLEDLFARLRIAAVVVRGAARDVRDADAPEELRDERTQLADRLLALSDEIVGTVETLESVPNQALGTSALNFGEWDKVQAELADLRRQGVKVPPLERHKPELKRQ